jgi:tetratricopeptide (TPR) repeat protein
LARFPVLQFSWPNWARLVVDRRNDSFLHRSHGAYLLARIGDTAVESYRLRAHAYRDTGRLQAALQDYEKIVAIQPEGWTYSYRAYLYHELGRYAEALKDYDAAIASDRDSASDHNGRALTLVKLGRKQEALIAYSQAVTAASRTFAQRMSDLETDEHRKNQAEVWRSRHQESRDRSLTIAHAGRGTLFRDLGRYDEAMAEYEAALQIRPNYEYVYRSRGWLYEEQGNRDAARADYEKAASIQAPDAWLTRALERMRTSGP